MNEADLLLSAKEIDEKYPQGSPDYPTHIKGCGCSGCYASWCEWRGANAALKNRFAFLATNQTRVTAWVRECFTEAEAKDAPERSLRTAEEALELAQAVGVDAETLHRLVDYVFSRPVGKPEQEIAGTMVTLYAMANALDVDADAAFETELERIQTPEVIERCRRRQHEKREALAGLKVPYAALDGLSADGRELTPFERPKKRKSWNP